MRFLRDNGLTITLLLMFTFSVIGMVFAGIEVQNHELAEHGLPPTDLVSYFFGSPFQSALFENWESEFLQMATYVVLTAFLFQRGSSESKDPDERQAPEDEDPARKAGDPDAPWPVRAGGAWRRLYSYSLGIVLVALFVMSFVLHWLHSAGAANRLAEMHGQPTETALQYLASPELWFESLQNWQSEFLSTAVIVALSIVLRFKGSPESKPVAAPHGDTGH